MWRRIQWRIQQGHVRAKDGTVCKDTCNLSCMGSYPFLVLTFVSCYAGNFSSFSHSLSAVAFASSIFHKNKLVRKIPAMWSLWSLVRDPSNRLLVDSSASTMHANFVLQFPVELQVTLCWLLLILHGIAAVIGISNFLLAFFRVFKFFIFWINNVNSSQSSGIIESWFLDSPLLFFSALRSIGHILPNLGPQVIWPGCCLSFCQSIPDHVYPSGGLSFNMVKRVNPVQASDTFRSLSTFQSSSIRRSSNTSKVALVGLVTSIYFNGIGNVSSLGTQSLILVSTWWR